MNEQFAAVCRDAARLRCALGSRCVVVTFLGQ